MTVDVEAIKAKEAEDAKNADLATLVGTVIQDAAALRGSAKELIFVPEPQNEPFNFILARFLAYRDELYRRLNISLPGI